MLSLHKFWLCVVFALFSLSMFLISPVNALEQGTAYHWNFDENSNEQVNGVYNGNNTGVKYADGKFGKAAEFTGAASYLDFGKTDINLGKNFTMAFWMKAAPSEDYSVLLAKGSKDIGHFEIYIHKDDGTLRVYSPEMGDVNTKFAAKDNIWYHVVIVCKSLDLKLYVDGVEIYSGKISANITDETDYFAIGGLADFSLPYIGLLDEIYILSWSVDQSTINEIMNNSFKLVTIATPKTTPIPTSTVTATLAQTIRPSSSILPAINRGNNSDLSRLLQIGSIVFIAIIAAVIILIVIKKQKFGDYSITKKLKIMVFILILSSVVISFLDSSRITKPIGNGELIFNTVFSEVPGMVKRERWTPTSKIAAQAVNWKELLTLNDLYCVVGNQTISHAYPKDLTHSLGVGDVKNEDNHPVTGTVNPGLECVEFYPLAKGNVNGGEMDIMPAIISFYDNKGVKLDTQNQVEKRQWRPDLQTEYFKVGNTTFVQEISNWNDIFICKIKAANGKLPSSFQIDSKFGGSKGVLEIEKFKDMTFMWGQEKDWSDTAFGLWCNKSLEVLKSSKDGAPIQYIFKGSSDDEIIFAYSTTYSMIELQTRMKSVLQNPEQIFEESTNYWNNYFTTIVPYFNCSNENYVRQYYYTYFCLMANVWDIPFAPIQYPFTCTSKLIWKWSWPWNSMFDNVTLRWMNDKTLAEGNILLPLSLGRTLLHALPPNYSKSIDLIPADKLNKFPPTQNLSTYDAIWETYLVTGNKEWLKEVYPAIVTHYKSLQRQLNSNGLPGWGLDEWDATARFSNFSMDTAIDSASFMLSGTYSLKNMALVLGDTAYAEQLGEIAETLKSKTQTLLWDDKGKIFLDANVKTKTFSPLKSAASFDPLYSGAATAEQAKFLVGHLTDPKMFWTKYPIPAISIDTPSFNAAGKSIGNGPIAPISCTWFQINGLANYGYNDLVKQLISKQIEMYTLNGVSSAVKYNPLTGQGLSFFESTVQNHSLCTMNATIVDLVISYVAGFNPREDGLIEFNPIAIDTDNWQNVSWGPFDYKDKIVSMSWTKKDGMTITCNNIKYASKDLRKVILKYENDTLTEISEG